MTPVLAIGARLLASCAVLAASAQTSSPPRPQAPPDEIAQFYGDVNFVAAFSTRLDWRHIRAVQRRQRFEALQSEADSTSRRRVGESLSAREQEVALRLIRINRRTLRIDDIALLGLGMSEAVAAPELMRVVGHEWSGETLCVRVEVWPITPEYGDRLTVDYEQRGRRGVRPVPPPEGLAGHSRLEAHRWRRVNDQWMRMQGVVVHRQNELS